MSFVSRQLRNLLLLSLVGGLIGCDKSPGRGANEAEGGKPAASATPPPSVDEALDRLITYSGAKDFSAEMKLKKMVPGAKPEELDLRLQRKFSEGGARSFLQVLAPAEETDKALLAIEKPDQPTEAFSYLAGLKKVAKLSSSRQIGFRGSKIAVQDMLGLELGKYIPGPPERVTDANYTRIRVILKEKPDLGLAYPRIEIFFTDPSMTPARIDLFDAAGEAQKRIIIMKVGLSQGKQVLSQAAVEDLQQKLVTLMEVTKVEFDRNLDDSLFTEDRLKSTVTSASRKIDSGKGSR